MKVDDLVGMVVKEVWMMGEDKMKVVFDKGILFVEAFDVGSPEQPDGVPELHVCVNTLG